MGVVAVIGSGARVRGWALAGALIREAGTAEDARGAWTEVSGRGDVTVVLLDPAAQASLAGELAARPPAALPLVAVLPV